MNTTTKEITANSKTYSKAGLLEIIDALPIAIAVIDKETTVELANRAMYRLVNKKEIQLIGLVGGEAFGCIHHDEAPEGCGFGPECLKCKLRKTVQETMEQKKTKSMVETSMVLKKHGKRDLRISTSPMSLNGDEVVLLAIKDITEEKKQEQIKMEKEKLSAVIQTAGAICHEMNQPLMVIQGFSDLLLEDISGESIQNSNIKEIKKQAERLGEITRKLMTITHYKTKDYLNSEIIDIEAASEPS